MIEWRPVVGYEDSYEVSNEGQVRSLTRIVSRNGHNHTVYGRVLKQALTRNGFVVGLSLNGKNHLKKTHRLVAEAFIENPRKLPLVDHKDTVNTNNKVSNLRWANVILNGYNSKKAKDNTSGIKNVGWHSRDRVWVVQINVNRKSKWLGCYEDLKLAELVAIEARNKYHGEFANHGDGYIPKVTHPFK